MFFSSKRAIDPHSGIERRHHLHESVVQKAVRSAVRAANIPKKGSCHTLRHSFAALICWKTDTTFEPFNNCSGTRT